MESGRDPLGWPVNKMAIAHTVCIGLLGGGRGGYYGAQAHADLEAALRAALSMSCTSAAVVVRDYATGRRFSKEEARAELVKIDYEKTYLWEMENL